MPRFPSIAARITQMQGGVFSRLAHKIAAIEGERYPLHVGDTWMEPLQAARLETLGVDEHPGIHRYAVPHGHPRLLAAIEERRGVGRDQILVTAGATGGLGSAAGAQLEPGDEVLILAPFWPLIRGIVQSARGVAVEVPFWDRAGTIEERIEGAITDRTVAIYINTPNNPTGRVLTADETAALGELARRHDLWVWSDEVYEDYAWARPHVPVASAAPERTLSAFSFSKAYGMAGNRVGYVLGPADVMLQLRKVSTHSFYAAPTGPQIAAAVALQHGASWVEQAGRSYRDAGNAAADALGLPRPEGGTFLFFDVAARLDERGLHGFLEDCVDRNLLLAPGTSCGKDYGTFVRLCYTSAPPDVVARGVEHLRGLMG